MNIRVIGGGWYGCHIALSLKKAGHDVTVFERGPTAFSGASGSNQSRLHRGFHYPRDKQTRIESLEGFDEFMARYPNFTRAIPCNIYAVAKDKSLIDYPTYLDTMRSTGADFVEIGVNDHGLTNMQGAVLTGERLILANEARDWFTKELGSRLQCGAEVDPNDGDDDWDLTIDCTFGSHALHKVEWFEPCIMLLFEGPTWRAVTVMDGPDGVSVYPYYQNGLVSLTTVRETPLKRCGSMAEARETISSLDADGIDYIRHKMLERVDDYLPSFRDEYKPVGHACAVRVKPVSGSDRRSCIIGGGDRVITVFPGKISTVFDAERIVGELIREKFMGQPTIRELRGGIVENEIGHQY